MSAANITTVTGQQVKKPESGFNRFKKGMYKSRYLYVLFIPVIIYYLIFAYTPMYGLIIAFKQYHPVLGILKSPWVGLDNFKAFTSSIFFWRLIKNTLSINIYFIAVGFPAPIILALMINELKNDFIKKQVQTLVYLPHFISVVIISGIIIQFLSPSSGIINYFISLLGFQPIHFLAKPEWFQTVFVWSGVWQSVGWSSIIYLAAITGIDPELYEAATVDGASNIQKIISITIPCIIPTIVTMFILKIGQVFSVGFEKIMLLYNPNTYVTADVISTYIYRRGIQNGEYGLSTAIGLFNGVLNFFMLVVFNNISRKVSATSLW
jgi:putative aldouronate transport system permease protein